ncbi:MAG: ssDNA-binding domain-containing protein [Firmicutes bacterium]|nr:ssDNA-binding domain-containing protein [Bacillota bacterium]
MKNTEKAKEALGRLLNMFETGNLPAAVARTVIQAKAGGNKPSDKWSLGNRLLMALADTDDARGFKQWQEVGRQVKKGAKAFYILAPFTKKNIVKVWETDPETGEEREVEQERTVITGFHGVPVFRYEDTEGKPLPGADYDPPEPPPLFEVARRFVSDVRYKPFVGGYYGYFRPDEIVLHTHDVRTFFHELAHAVHHTLKPGGLKGGQHADQEIVAEVTAAALCEMYGYQGYIWHGWEYIKRYSSHEPQKALKAVMGVLADVEKVLEIILGTNEEAKSEKAA